jgi:hypothetical protein
MVISIWPASKLYKEARQSEHPTGRRKKSQNLVMGTKVVSDTQMNLPTDRRSQNQAQPLEELQNSGDYDYWKGI